MDMIRSMFGPSYASWQAMQAALPPNLQALMPKVDAEALDAVFYDVGLILDEEAALLKEHRAGEGDVLVVQPSASHGRTLEVFHSVKELAAAIGRDSRNSPRTPAPRPLGRAGGSGWVPRRWRAMWPTGSARRLRRSCAAMACRT